MGDDICGYDGGDWRGPYLGCSCRRCCEGRADRTRAKVEARHLTATGVMERMKNVPAMPVPGFMENQLSRMLTHARTITGVDLGVQKPTTAEEMRRGGFTISDPKPAPRPDLSRREIEQWCKKNGYAILTEAELAKLQRQARGNAPPPIAAEIYKRVMRFG